MQDSKDNVGLNELYELLSSNAPKRVSHAEPARAAVPVWRTYNLNETDTFGDPQAHERKYGENLSPRVYTAGVSEFVSELSMRLIQRKVDLPFLFNFIFMRVVIRSVGEDIQKTELVLSNLIFDGWAELYEVAHVMLWVVASLCIQDGICTLVVDNPLPLVYTILNSISSCYQFTFIEFKECDKIVSMSMDIKAMKSLILSTKADVSFDTLKEYPRVMGADMRFFNSVLNTRTLRERAYVVNPGYLVNFSYFLLRLHHSFEAHTSFTAFTDVARVKILITNDSEIGADRKGHNWKAVVVMLDIRPCAQRLQFARILLWRLMRTCVIEGFSRLEVDTAYRHSAALCISLGFSCTTARQQSYGLDIQASTLDTNTESKAIDTSRPALSGSDESVLDFEDRNYEIKSDLMGGRMLPSQCGIYEGKLTEHPGYREFFELNQDAFPTFQQLNCQAYVDARGIASRV